MPQVRASGADVRFDDGLRPSTSDQPMPAGGAVRALRDAADSAGLDAISELYNEALRYATEGHLRLARERLNVLLGMSPDDGPARLLLAKIHVAGQRWQDALTALDEAQSCGMAIPLELRTAVEEHLRADVSAADDGGANRAREAGEVKALRQEARRLRSENAELLGKSHDLERETRKWAWTTAAVAVLGLGFVFLNVVANATSGLFGGDEVAEVPPAEVVTPVVVEGSAPTEAGAAVAPAAPEVVPTTPAAIAEAARLALQNATGLDDTELSVVVRGSQATVTGEVVTAKQKKRAESVLKGTKGITSVDASGVKILARTAGTTHTVAKGDTLSKIALEYYGDGTLSSKIQAANGGKTDLSIGQVLKIPAVQ